MVSPRPIPFFGTQLQNRASFGIEKEANFVAIETDGIIEFQDGTTTILYKAEYRLTDPYRPLPNNIILSPRVAPAVFGIGLLEAIAEAKLLAQVDENDANGDNISGKANRVWSV